MTKYSKPNYCPEWFNLNEYEMIKNWDHIDWLKNISIRVSFFMEFEEKPINDKTEDDSGLFPRSTKEKLIEQIKEHLTCIKNERNNSNSASTTERLDYTTSYESYQRKLNPENSIKEIDNGDFLQLFIDFYLNNLELRYLILRAIEEVEINKKIYVSINELSTIDEMNELVKPMINQNGWLQYLETNLFYSNDVLIDKFKQKLNLMRKSINDNKGKKLTDVEIKSLIDYRVIPYIDLMLWGMVTNKQFTVPQMANLLFPDEYDIDCTERIRKTTKPKALELLTQILKFI